MKYWHAIFNGLLFGILLSEIMSCCTINLGDIRTSPHYKGVDPAIQPYVDRYFALAKEHGIEFKNKVSIGFTHINIKDTNAIGVCYSSDIFREIDIDVDFWHYASPTSRETLLRHELTHCYCGRAHDWAKGKNYPESNSIPVKTPEDIDKLFKITSEGRYEDSCPLSLMHPYIVDDRCVWEHYQAYTDEIFQRCEAY